MRLPFFIGFHGRRVPEWFWSIKPSGDDVKLYGVVVIYNRNNRYTLRPIFPQSVLIVISGNRDLIITGQKPNPDGGMAYVCTTPIVPVWLTSLICGALGFAMMGML